jgi:hypothetical protein
MCLGHSKEVWLRQADVFPDYRGPRAQSIIVGLGFCQRVLHIANRQHGQPRDQKVAIRFMHSAEVIATLNKSKAAWARIFFETQRRDSIP